MDTIFTGKAAPLSNTAFEEAQDTFATDAPSIWSLLTVESRGFGYLNDKRPKILFERHIFHRRTSGAYDLSDPDISDQSAGGYIGGAGEYPRLARAMLRDRKAALESASWGMGQVMGFNALGLGYNGAQDMIERFKLDEDEQLDAMVRFVTGNPSLLSALRQKKWKTVAFFYNGKNYAKNDYQVKLERFHDLYLTQTPPDVELRAAQARLTYCGFDPGGVDGRLGNNTTRAVMAFQRSKRLSETGIVGDVADALKEAAGV